MKTAIVLLSGVVFAFTSIAASSDQFAQERYRMKYGRYTSAEEARRKATVAAEKSEADDTGQACCRHLSHGTANTLNVSEDQSRFRAKFGRNAPVHDAVKNHAEAQMDARVTAGAGMGHCSLAHASPAVERAAAANPTDTEARFRMKYGRVVEPEERHAHLAEERTMTTAAAGHSTCTEACCTQSE